MINENQKPGQNVITADSIAKSEKEASSKVTIPSKAVKEAQIKGIETRADLIEQYVIEYKKAESNELVCEKLGIAEASGLKILSNKHVFSVLASEGCYFDSEAIYAELLDKEQGFINEYMVDFNPTAAAGRAGYKDPYSAARRHLTDSRIRFIIMCRQQELREISQVTSQAVANELAKIAFADIGDFVEFDNNIVTLKDSRKVDTSVISEVQSTQYGVKIKLHNKHAALEALGKHLGMFREKIEITGKDGDPIKIQANLGELRVKLDTIIERAKEQAVSELIADKEAEIVPDNNEPVKEDLENEK